MAPAETGLRSRLQRSTDRALRRPAPNRGKAIPVTDSNVVESYIGPFAFNYAKMRLGNISTKSYVYGVERGNKFSDLTVAKYDETCSKLRELGAFPIARIDTNSAYQLATQWLAAVSMDVKGLNRDCQFHVTLTEFWNGLKPGERPHQRFVPMILAVAVADEP